MGRINRVSGCGNSHDRIVGFNCGEFPPVDGVTDHWPICTGFRGGNWHLPASLAFGPYSPDTIDLDGIDLEFISADLWRSATLTRSVRVGGLEVNGVQVNGPVIGTYRYYLELEFTGAEAGEAVLTAHTVEHPDSRFPEAVLWDNKLPLAESTILTLVDSTNFADAVELLPFLTMGLPAPLSPYPEAHGVPMYNADGTYHSIYRTDPLSWKRVTTGEIPCSHTITGTTSEVTWCVDVLIEDFPLFCLVGETLTEHLHDATSDQSITGTAHDGSAIGDQTALRMVGEATNCGGTGLGLYELEPGRDYNTVSRIELSWEADCDGVTVTAVATIKSVYGSANLYTLTFVWEDLPFDWWESPLTQTATFTLTRPDATTVERDITLTLTPYDCDYGYYPDLSCPECLPAPLYVTISGEGVTGGTYDLHWAGDNPEGCHWGMTGLTPATGTGTGYQILVELREYASYAETPWWGTPCEIGEVYVLLARVFSESTGAYLDEEVAAHICILCGPESVFGMVSYPITLGGNTITLDVFD